MKKQTAGRDRRGDLAPKFAELNDDVLFGEVWSREKELSPRDRSMITIAALFSAGLYPQLKSHLALGKLKRLGTDYVDLYYQHRIDPNVEPEEAAGVMSELIKEGKILHWGISETNEGCLRRAHAVCPVTCIQNRYSMMARWNENLFPVLEELHIGYVAFSPLANGILSDAFAKGTKFDETDYRSAMPQYSDEAFEKNQALLALIRSLAEEKQATPAQISLAWMLGKKPYIVPIPGSRKAERIKENFGAAEVVLTADEVKAIDEKLDSMEMSTVFGGSPVKK